MVAFKIIPTQMGLFGSKQNEGKGKIMEGDLSIICLFLQRIALPSLSFPPTIPHLNKPAYSSEITIFLMNLVSIVFYLSYLVVLNFSKFSWPRLFYITSLFSLIILGYSFGLGWKFLIIL